MKALFLGAGASYECGMPLVWEFTNILRANVLRRLDTHLFDFRSAPNFRASFERILSNPNLHYEQMVGELESICLAGGAYSKIARTVLVQLIDCVQMLLLEDQMHTTGLFREKVKDYAGIQDLLGRNPCLHVFSLNHDINFEEICRFHGIELRDGFFRGGAERYQNIAEFTTLTREKMDSGNLSFLGTHERGVNLIKLHGSLDIFAVEDRNLYLKCAPTKDNEFGAYMREIVRVEKHSHEVCARIQSRTVGELNVMDVDGELQFMRRSLLSGANKFQGSFDQIAPLAFFQEFKKRVHWITEMDVIGYGFGDNHINAVLFQWLRESGGAMNIYDPHRKILPSGLENQGGRVNIVNAGLTEYFNGYGGSQQSLSSGARKWMLDKARERLRQRRLAAWKAADDAATT